MVYQDKESGKAFGKRFQIGGVTRDKLYSLVKADGSRLVFFHRAEKESAMPKILRIRLDGRSRARIREFDFDISRVPVSSRASRGLTISKWPVREVVPAP
jgi:topoisomerase-4 subunit A